MKRQRKQLSLLLLLLACSVPVLAKPPAGKVQAEVPFTLEKGHIIVAAKVLDKKPVELAIVTGAEHSIINGSSILKYKIQAYSISFVNISFPEVPVTVYPKNSQMDASSSGYSAIIGVAVLQNFITTFDFGGGVLALERN